jgi:hypothetical protein
MTGADEPTRQPPAYRPIGPMRAALVLAMAVVIGGSLVRNAPLRRQAAQRARAASELISANAQTRLACFYASLEAQGAPTPPTGRPEPMRPYSTATWAAITTGC